MSLPESVGHCRYDQLGHCRSVRRFKVVMLPQFLQQPIFTYRLVLAAIRRQGDGDWTGT